MMQRFSKHLWVLFSSILAVGLLVQSVFASLPFNDSRSLSFDSGVITLYMGQNGSSFYLDSVNVGGKPLSCEIKAGTTLSLRNNCDDVSFSYSEWSENISIYVQYDNDQGTWIYNSSSKTFTSAVRGTQNVTDPNDTLSTTNGYISLSSDNSSVRLNQYIDLYVRTYTNNGTIDTSNRDQIRFTILRQSGSSYYTASSSDYYLRNDRYTMTSSDAGYAVLSDYVRFYTSGTYKIRVENMTTWRTSETVVYVGNNWWSTTTTATSFDIGVSETNPSIDEYIDTTVTARDSNGNRAYNYVGTIKYSVEKRDTNSSFWYSASSDEYTLSTTSRYLGSSQEWYLSLSNHLRFTSNGNYRLRVVDSSNSSVYGIREFSVWGSSSTTSSRFELSSNRTNLTTNEYADLTIRARNSNGYTNTSYANTVRFEVYRRANSSESWSPITSSSTDNTHYRISHINYSFSSNQNGVATLTNFIRFKSNSYDYKVRVVDSSNSSVYGEITYYLRNSGSSTDTSDIYRYAWQTSPALPQLYDYIDITLLPTSSSNTTVSASNTVQLSLERKLLPTSSVWTSTPSTSCKLLKTSAILNSSTVVDDVVRCTKKWFYRLKITSNNNSRTVWYVYFTILDSNDFVKTLGWFTNTQRQEVQEEYRTFMDQVNRWESQYPRLAYNISWNNLWKNYYIKLNRLAYNKPGRITTYSAYERARDAFNDSFNDMK